MRNTEPTPIRRGRQLHAPQVPSLLATAPRLEAAQARAPAPPAGGAPRLVGQRPVITEKQTEAAAPIFANAADQIDRRVQEIVDTAPPLTPEQRDRLVVLLRGAAR